MIYLILSIVCSTLLVVAFKLFDKHQINTSQAIVFNYISAAFIGFLYTRTYLKFTFAIVPEWFGLSIFLGLLFIIIFHVIALTTQRVGITSASVANKMSLIIPTLAAWLLYGEVLSVVKIVGIVLALAAVLLVSQKQDYNDHDAKQRRNMLLPLLLFIGSGFIDAFLNYAESNYLQEEDFETFIFCLFSSAAAIGIIVLLYNIFVVHKSLHLKSIIAGLLLGIPNYYSIYLLLKALHTPDMPGSTFFPINNIGIVLLSALIGLFIFKEKLSKVNWLGIALALLSIIFIFSF